MTAKDKAQELVNKFLPNVYCYDVDLAKRNAKECALICIDEIFKTMDNEIHKSIKSEKWNHYERIKQELEKLGFEYSSVWKRYKLCINDKCIYIIINSDVILEQENNEIVMFKYNHEKLKQLIEILK